MDIRTFAEKARPLGVLAMKITQNNQELAYEVWDDECRRNLYSASKSFTSAAVGFAVQEGLLSLDEPLIDAFPRDLPPQVDENLRRACVRDLLTMHLGQANGNLMGAQRPFLVEEDWVKLALRIPFVHAPGTQFVYNNVGPYLAGILVQRRSGCDLVSYLQPRLFSPLHIHRPTWETDPLGNTFGAGGLFLNLSEFHKFGLLYLQNGNWEGKQLLQADWIVESTRQHYAAPYGYLFWRGEHNSYRADGKYMQISMVLAEKNAVIMVVSECRNANALFRTLYDDLCTQL